MLQMVLIVEWQHKKFEHLNASAAFQPSVWLHGVEKESTVPELTCSDVL